MIPQSILPIVLLTLSNVFMTFAWYGHLKFTSKPLWLVIIVSWGIAFFEYCLAVPGKPLRPRSLFSRGIEDDAGSDYPDRLRDFLCRLSR